MRTGLMNPDRMTDVSPSSTMRSKPGIRSCNAFLPWAMNSRKIAGIQPTASRMRWTNIITGQRLTLKQMSSTQFESNMTTENRRFSSVNGRHTRTLFPGLLRIRTSAADTRA